MTDANKLKKELKETLNGGTAGKWVIIVVCFALFFPLGIYMAHQHLSIAKVAAVGGSQTAKYAAIGLLAVGAIGILIGLFPVDDDNGEPQPLVVSAIMVVFGLGCGYGGISTLKNYKQYEALSGKYKQYLLKVVNNDCYNIEDLAKSLNVDYGTALQKVEEMVDLGLFQGAYIDYQAKELVWGERPVAEIVTVSCVSCGASNDAIVGKNNKCKYCGSGLE